MSTHISILARKAELGKGKTRLAKTVGVHKALEIYKFLVAHTAKVIQKGDAHATVFFDPEIGDEHIWVDTFFNYQTQFPFSDLGDRIWQALDCGLLSHTQSMVIGTDCPDLTPSHISRASKLLEDHDLVAGPSLDGGFYLLGVKQHFDGLFDGIEWSTPQVYEHLKKGAHILGLSVGELPTLNDIDTEEDWKRYLKNCTNRTI